MILRLEVLGLVLHIELGRAEPEPDVPPDSAPQPMVVYADPPVEEVGFHGR